MANWKHGSRITFYFLINLMLIVKGNVFEKRNVNPISTIHLSDVSCHSNDECLNKEDICVRGQCRTVFKSVENVLRTLPDECLETAWPDVQNCVTWYTSPENELRIMESNSVPPYEVPPYCPFGIGQGYCQSPVEGDSTDCDPFRGMTCPCVEGTRGCETSTDVGDVLKATYQYFEFPLNPDPTIDDLPRHMYNNTCLKSGMSYQVIGAHLNGIQFKGPAEANGFNVDTSLIPLPCGGHVTPPVGPGPQYHYHKAADCQDIQEAGEHGPLIGYIADGFGIYGFGDFRGMPVLDECHGHFGAVPDTGELAYHYHVSDEYNIEGVPHKPYYLGCLGPSRGMCNSTVSDVYDFGANWCGQGCGFDVCVQPGTDPEALYQYLDRFPAGRSWLDGLSVNDFEI